MTLYKSIRNGFTMLEVIFVIIILGIVSSIGAEIIAQTYGSYIVQRAQYRANIKTELALTQIANRLRYAIQNTVVVRPTLSGAFTRIELVTDPDTKVLQWVGYDGDSFEAITSAANRKPGWSGFADIDPTSAVTTSTNLRTPGSNLVLASSIISNLGGSLGNARIYFAEGDTTAAGLAIGYAVNGGNGENITLSPGIPTGEKISERYKLAWSSYALEVDANNDLILHYNFTPVAGTVIAGSNSILLHDVTNFRFKSSGGAFRLKICKTERISGESSETIHACKEKVVF